MYYKPEKVEVKSMRYLNYLNAAFNVRSPQGTVVPYVPVSWQIDFHRNSLLVNKDQSKNDFVMKGRGISFSYSAMIEAINVGLTYPGTLIPVFAHRFRAAQDIVGVGRWLVDNANVKISYNKKKDSELEIYTKYGTSVIRPYPSGSPSAIDAVRSARPVFGVIDEGGIIKNLKELIVALQDSMQTKETKFVVGGTPKGKTNHFWEMGQKKLEGYNKYYLPMFDESVTPENIFKLRPLVWWIDKEKLRDKLINDPDSFAQEYMCSPYNDTESLIPLIDIENSIGRDFEFDKWYILMGVDIATSNDYAVISVFKTDGTRFKQIDLQYFKQISLDEFEGIIRDYIQRYNPEEVRIDSTGIGAQIGQNLVREFACAVAVNFSSSVNVNGEHINVRKYMINNFKYFMMKSCVEIMDDKLQVSHIASVDKNMNLNSRNGHNDIFIADCLALLPLNFKNYPYYTDTTLQKKPEEKKDVEELISYFKNPRKKFQDFGVIGFR